MCSDTLNASDAAVLFVQAPPMRLFKHRSLCKHRPLSQYHHMCTALCCDVPRHVLFSENVDFFLCWCVPHSCAQIFWRCRLRATPEEERVRLMNTGPCPSTALVRAAPFVLTPPLPKHGPFPEPHRWSWNRPRPSTVLCPSTTLCPGTARCPTTAHCPSTAFCPSSTLVPRPHLSKRRPLCTPLACVPTSTCRLSPRTCTTNMNPNHLFRNTSGPAPLLHFAPLPSALATIKDGEARMPGAPRMLGTQGRGCGGE